MTAQTPGEITVALERAREGRPEALEELIALVYADLRRNAAALLHYERSDHTLHPTDLVHEAYLRLADERGLDYRDRRHFFGSAAVAMRRILVDYARRRSADKRIPAEKLVPIQLAAEPTLLSDPQLLLLDEALDRLAREAPRQARIVELRYFGGLTEGEVAEVLEVSRSTVSVQWRVAKLWLHRELSR